MRRDTEYSPELTDRGDAHFHAHAVQVYLGLVAGLSTEPEMSPAYTRRGDIQNLL